MSELHRTPDKEEIALLQPFERLELSQIQVVSTADQAAQAMKELSGRGSKSNVFG